MHLLSKIKLPARLENLYSFIDTVSQCASEQGFSQKRINEIELITEEALVNIFNYAYQGKNGDVEVICSINKDERFIVNIIDSGVPFDIFSYEKPSSTLDISEREFGGLGIFLIRKYVDDIQYRREDDINKLTFIFIKKMGKAKEL